MILNQKKTLNKLLDPKFYLENFTKIKGKTPGLIPFVLNDAQKDLFNTLRVNPRVMILKARQIGFCLSPQTKILLSNLEWINLDEIAIGQEIVSVEESPTVHKGSLRRMKVAVVEGKREVFEPAFKLKMSNDKELIATAQHRFLSRIKGDFPIEWRSVGEIVVGDEIKILSLTCNNRKSDWWVEKFLPDNNSWAKVIAIEPLGTQRMIDLQTSTKTFIANGYVSHNSTAVTGYLYHKTITNPGTNTALIGYNSDLTAELLDKVKTIYRTTPRSIQPTIQYNSKYEITFPAIDSKILVLPSSENVGRGYTLHNVLCISGDASILTVDGGTKKISETRDGDFIVNGRGETTKIIKKWKKENVNGLIEVVVSQGISTKFTPEHSLLVWSDAGPTWKMVKDLTIHDYLACPIKKIKSEIKTLEIMPTAGADKKENTKKIITTINLGYDFGLFVGWYLAKGSCVGNKICISVNNNEVSSVSKVIDSSILGNSSSYGISYSKKSRTAVINIHGRSFASFMASLFGKTSLEKKIPDSVWNYGKDFCRGLIWGIFSGNGFLKSSRMVSFSGTNYSVMIQVQRLISSLGIGYATIERSKTCHGGKVGMDRFDIRLCDEANNAFRKLFRLPIDYNNIDRKNFSTFSTVKKDKEYIYKMVLSLNNVPSEREVYDLMVASDDHSFLTNSLLCVKNCTELAFWDRAEEKMLAIENAVPKNGTIVIESTPNAIGNLYHRMWMADNGYAKKKYGWWWHYTEEEIEIIRKRINNPMRFAQEYELEFLSSGRPVFPTELVKRCRKNILRVGDKVYDENKSEYTVTKNEDGLIMYFPPRPGRVYVVGVDVAEGVTGGDLSVAVFWDRETGEEVAFWRGYIPPDRFGVNLNRWGRLYNDALMVVEINNHGLTTVTALKNLLYPQMYFRQANYDSMGTSWSDRLGWRTTKVTRPLMIDDLRDALQEGSIKIHSETTLDEMLTFVFDDNGNMVAQKSFHDDGIFASAIGFQGFKVLYGGKLDQINYEDVLPRSFNY